MITILWRHKMAFVLPFKLRTIAAAVVVIGSGMIILNAYQSIIETTDGNLASLPIIAAEKRPFRIAPENPGGEEIPNKGSTLFNVLNAENGDALVLDGVKIDQEQDNTLSAQSVGEEVSGFELPEIPETRTESLYKIINELKDTPDSIATEEIEDFQPLKVEEKIDLKAKLQTAIEKIEDKQKETLDENLDEIKPDLVAVNTPVPMKKPSKPAIKIVETAQPIPSKNIETAFKPQKSYLDAILQKQIDTKRHYIQLVSVKTEAEARSEYDRIRRDFPNLVSGATSFYPRANLGERGDFIRLQIGPFDSQLDAQKRCNIYTSSNKGGTCLVLSR